LPLDIGEIGRRGIETLRQQRSNEQGRRGLGAKETRPVIDLIDRRAGRGAHRRGVRLIQQNRHLAQNGAGLGDYGDHGIALENLEFAFHQNIQVAGGFAFPDKHGLSGKIRFLLAGTMFENGAHIDPR